MNRKFLLLFLLSEFAIFSQDVLPEADGISEAEIIAAERLQQVIAKRDRCLQLQAASRNRFVDAIRTDDISAMSEFLTEGMDPNFIEQFDDALCIGTPLTFSLATNNRRLASLLFSHEGPHKIKINHNIFGRATLRKEYFHLLKHHVIDDIAAALKAPDSFMIKLLHENGAELDQTALRASAVNHNYDAFTYIVENTHLGDEEYSRALKGLTFIEAFLPGIRLLVDKCERIDRDLAIQLLYGPMVCNDGVYTEKIITKYSVGLNFSYIYTSDKSRHTPLALARIKGARDVEAVLLRHGATEPELPSPAPQGEESDDDDIEQPSQSWWCPIQ